MDRSSGAARSPALLQLSGPKDLCEDQGQEPISYPDTTIHGTAIGLAAPDRPPVNHPERPF